jgi:hypothetical protein
VNLSFFISMVLDKKRGEIVIRIKKLLGNE